MLRWFKDLMLHFRRPINGGGNLPNYGNIPDEILYEHRFDNSDAQMEVARRIMRKDRDMLRKLKDE